MPQTVEIPAPVTSPATDKQIVVGPGGKKYVFSKGISSERINKYFTKQGWVQKDGKWLTASGEDAGGLSKVGSPVPNESKDVLKRKGKLDKSGVLQTNAVLGGVTALPAITAGAGGMFGGVPGAALGGFVGEDLRQLIMRPILLSAGQQDLSVTKSLVNMGTEGIKQGALQYAGDKAGELFFNTLNKAIPHAVIKKGIPLLPGDLNPNSKVMRYTEDLLSNLIPSSSVMSAFRDKQTAAILSKTDKLAQGFSKFNGTSEELGVLLQNTMEKQENLAYKALKAQAKSLPAGKSIQSTPEYKDFVATFKNQLAKSVVGTENPELIAGYLRTSKAGLENTRRLLDLVHEVKPDLIGKVQNRIMRDVFSEVFTGSRDPTLKANLALNKGFSGPKFKAILDGIGEDKLKVLYGEKGLKNINEFETLIAHVDKTQGNGAGKFLNLIFMIPFRSGTGAKSIGKTAGLAFIFNRAAKIITSPKGIGIYENYVRAAGQQAPRAMELARQELKTFNERSDAEYKLEEQEAEEQIKKQQENK